MKNGIHIDRPSKWGNPFLLGRDGGHEEILYKYQEWILQNKDLLSQLKELHGKNLTYSPETYHINILRKLSSKR